MEYISSFERIVMEEGRQEGLKEGRQEGLLLGQRTALERLLRNRFGQLPDWVAERIRTATVQQVEGFLDAALNAQTLDAVFASPS